MTSPTPLGLAQQTALALRMLTLGRLAGQAFNWIATLLVIRLLDAQDYGLMALAVMFIASAAILSELGIGQALVQRQRLDRDTQARAFGLLLVISGVALSFQCLIAKPAANWFEAPQLAGILIALAWQFPITALGTLPDVMLRRQMLFGRKAWVEFCAMLVGSALTLGLAWKGYGVWSLVLGNLAMVSTRTAGFWLAQPTWIWPRLHLRGNRELLRFGGALTAGHFLWIIYTQADIFLISKSLGPVTLGVYAIAMQIATLPMQKLASIINDVGLSALSRLANQPDEFRRQFLRGVEITSALTFPIFFGLAAIASEFVPLVLGQRWLEVAPILALLCLSLPLRMLATLLPTALHAFNRTGISLLIRAITAAIMVASFAVGVRYGVIGVAWAWSLAFPVAMALSLALALPALGISWGRFLTQCWPFALAASVMLLVLRGWQQFGPQWHIESSAMLQSSLQLGSLCFLGAVCFIVCALALRPALPKQLLQLIRAR